MYTVNDIANVLKISRSKAYNLVNSNGFPAIKIGTTIRVPKEEFEKWINKFTGRTFGM